MSFNVHLYTSFKKKKNSTKTPSGDFHDFPCVLKEPSSIFNPTIIVSFGNPDNFGSKDNAMLAYYTHAYIPEFKRYYFIEDITYIGRNWEVKLTSDVLASFKSDILGATKYVLRSASAADGRVVDNLYPMIQDVDTSDTEYSCPYIAATGLAQGVFVLGIMNNGTGCSVGSTTYYVMKYGALQTVLNMMYDAQTYKGISDIVGGDALAMALWNPTQYLTSLMYLPYAPTNANVPLKIGYPQGNTSNFAAVSDHVQFFSGSVSFPAHPQGTEYLQKQPYTEYNIYFPCFGVIPVDASRVGARTVFFEVYCDNFTGSAKLILKGNDGNPAHLSAILGTYSGQIGVPLPVAQTIQNGGGMLSGLQQMFNFSAPISALAGGFTSSQSAGKNFMTGAGISAGATILQNAADGIGNSIASAFPQTHMSGSLGSFSELGFGSHKVHALAKFVKVTNKGNPQNGSPLMAQRVLNTLSGFTMCSDGAIDTEGNASEKEQIAAFLTGGFYIE